MRSLLFASALCLTLASCSAFQPGPVDPLTGKAAPSPFQIGLDEAAKTYTESPWSDFGPYGAVVAAILAGTYGVRKGVRAYRARQPKE